MPDVATIQVNEDHLPWVNGEAVSGVLARIGAEPDAVATAINGEFIPRSRRAETLLQPGDVLTVFKAIVGG